MTRKLAMLFLIVISAHCGGAVAVDLDTDMFSFNGFGTVSMVHNNRTDSDFSSGVFQPTGAGATRKWSLDPDSVFAFQMTAKFTDKLQGVVQIASQQRWNNTYRPAFEWANLKYSITPDLAIRVGRIAMPTYLFSDTRNVHYAMTAVRPAPEVYSLLPVTNGDGVDVSYTLRAGPVRNTIQVLYSDNRLSIAPGFSIHTAGIWGVVDTFEMGDLAVHASTQTQQLHYEQSFFSVPTTPYKIVEIGVNYDPGKWFIMAEGARTRITSIFTGDTKAFVVNAGARLGKFVPYLQFAKVMPLTTPSFGAPAKQRTSTAGVRWDGLRNIALKLQYDHIDIADGSPGLLVNRQPSFQPGGNVNLLTAAADFVF